MKIDITPELIEKLAGVLASTEQGELAVPATNALLAAPQLTLHPLIREQIYSVLHRDPRVDVRQRLALALDAAGDPRGLDHFIYCVLAFHPILGIDQRKQHGWGWRIGQADRLQEEHIHLLVLDMLEHGTFHAPTLAFANGQSLISSMREALSLEPRSARYAAYVLAFHGDDSGREILKKWVHEQAQYPQAPLEALLALADHDALSFVEPFCDPGHTLYQKTNPHHVGATNRILASVKIRFSLLTADGFNEKIAVIDHEYLTRLDEITIYNPDFSKQERKITPAINILGNYSKNTKELTTFLAETCNQEVTEYLCMRQWGVLENLFHREQLTYENMLDGDFLWVATVAQRRPLEGISRTGLRPEDKPYYGDLPVRIRYEHYDYLLAATDWIRFPIRYRWYPSVLS